MATIQNRIRAEHEIHGRRRTRNNGVGLLLLALVAIVFGLTVVKVTHLESIREFESYDHVLRPQLIPGQTGSADPAAADATTAPDAQPAAEASQ